jgi:hypothetical protein
MVIKKVHERSPLRVFERSIHGGLGAGNLGVVLSRPGMGKTSFMVGIALDILMRGNRVFHVALEQSVDHVREYYDEIFSDLARTSHLDDAASVRVAVERGRMVHTYLGHSFSMVKFKNALAQLREHLHFEPAAVMIDGFDFADDHYDEISEMREVARRASCELWMSARTFKAAPAQQAGHLPWPLNRYEDLLSVVVGLEPEGNRVRLRLLKDHDNKDLSALYLDLDPQTMLLIER